ncbi:hypothetical protein MRX96_055604 [Rhipicephalus microplus]
MKRRKACIFKKLVEVERSRHRDVLVRFTACVLPAGNMFETSYLMGVGQTDTDLTALFGAWRASQFAARLLDLRRRTAFCCVYLHWHRPSPIYRERVTRLAADLRAALRDYGVRLGFVVDTAAVEALNVRTLLATLGHGSLLVAPAPYPPSSSAATYPSYHNYEALRWHSRLAELAGNESARVCHTVSLAGVAITAANATLVPYDRICTARFLRTPRTRGVLCAFIKHHCHVTGMDGHLWAVCGAPAPWCPSCLRAWPGPSLPPCTRRVVRTASASGTPSTTTSLPGAGAPSTRSWGAVVGRLEDQQRRD